MTPKALRINSPDALVSNKRVDLKSLNPSNIEQVRVINESLKVNTPEWKIRVKSRDNRADHITGRAQIPQFDVFNGKEIHAIFTHFKSIVQISNTFQRKVIHEVGNSKVIARKSHWINSEIINFIINNLDKDKQDLFNNTWGFKQIDNITWEIFHDRIKAISFERLELR